MNIMNICIIGKLYTYTLPETNIASEDMPSKKEHSFENNYIILRGYVGFRGYVDRYMYKYTYK